MFAETVSIDGGVIALFLVVLLLVVLVWVGFTYVGYRLIRRGRSTAAFVCIGLVAVIDAWLVWLAVFGDGGPVAFPVAVHLIAAVLRLVEVRDGGAST